MAQFPSTSSASGIWSIKQQKRAEQGDNWPLMPLSSIELLLVGGGGGGGSGTDARPGAGGAGGLVYSAAFPISTATNYTITIGSGGAGGAANGASGVGGSDTTAFGLTAAGGGKGGGGPRGVACSPNGAGGNGGCGGGGMGFASYCAGGTSTQSGLNGAYSAFITQLGFAASTTPGGGGVGGGAGGQPASTSGSVGHGTSAYSSFLQAASAGENISGTYYIAGGGASEASVANKAYGGGGGSGTKEGGTINRTGSAGLANMGGGGGSFGSGNTSTVPAAYAGGSGIVIIRYSDAFPAATSTTGSPTIIVSGGFRIYKFNASGSITF